MGFTVRIWFQVLINHQNKKQNKTKAAYLSLSTSFLLFKAAFFALFFFFECFSSLGLLGCTRRCTGSTGIGSFPCSSIASKQKHPAFTH